MDVFRLKPAAVGDLAYRFRDAHPMLRWLPTKLSEWVADNLREELGFPDKCDARWSVQELNAILQEHLVLDRNGNSLECFGCVRWESDLYRGFMRARCYPFKLPELLCQASARCGLSGLSSSLIALSVLEGLHLHHITGRREDQMI